MNVRFLAPMIVFAALLVAPVATVSIAGQTKKAPAKAAAKKYTPPKTSWGDPDISGSFTNQSENGTPLEKPDQFEGRRLEDVTGEELLQIKREAQKRTIGNFEGPLHALADWWQPALNMDQGSQAWLIIDPPNGKIPALTAEAQQRNAARAEARRRSGRGPSDSWEDRSLYDRCITRGLPGSMMPAIYGNGYQIVQGPGYVAITYEMIHETRIIPTTPRPEPSPTLRAHMGYARGRWEGDTLVVETTNFRDESVYRQANASTLKLTERFTRISPEKVKWTVTVDDPKTWTAPWTFTMPLTKDDSGPVLEYSCHEGNLGLMNILSGARADDRKAAEEAAKGAR